MGFINTYGTFIDIHGHNMCVSVDGHGEEVIAIFPCPGSPSPILEMKALVSFLRKKYTVITIDGFGNGESDMPSTARTYRNIAGEMHETLKKLGFTRYSIITDMSMMLFDMWYIQKYSNEINALILIDMYASKKFLKSIIPKHTTAFLGLKYRIRNIGTVKRFTRLAAKKSLKKAKGYEYDQNDIDTYGLLATLNLSRNITNKASIILWGIENIVDIPILLIISKQTKRLIDKSKAQGKNPVAEFEPESVVFKDKGKIHLRHPECVSWKIRNFLESLKT